MATPIKTIDSLSKEVTDLRTFLDSAPCLINSVNANGIIVDCNHRLLEATGYTRKELIGQSMSRFVHPEDLPQVVQNLSKIMTSSTGFQQEFRVICKDGHVADLSVISMPVKDAEGRFLRTCCLATDITTVRQAQRENSQNNLLYQEIFSSAPIGIVVYDQDLRYVAWNPFMERLTERLASDVIGQKAVDLFPHLKKQGIDKLLDRALAGEPVNSGDFPYVPPSGKTVWVTSIYSPHLNFRGETVGVLMMLRDITERKNLEDAYYQSEKIAAVGRLAAGIAHELNNPLAVILGFSQSLLDRKPAGDSDFHPLKSIEREALRCRNLVQNLLVFSRQKNSKLITEDLAETIEGSLSLVEPQARLRNVAMKRHFDDNVPRIYLDRQQIQQVIMNLCTNALDAMPKGGTLLIRLKLEGDSAEIGITDTGMGIPLAARNHIFDPFFTTKDVGKGTGLGLSIVYEIVKKHGGAISFESEIDQGTTFRIRLPLQNKSARNGEG
ncbi:MAG: PAS domain S-box protein [Elusimicrobiota bacterium]|jgi:PAS domain S-box-containing protein